MLAFMHFILELLHHKLVSGALKNGGSWGGLECRSQINFETHVHESSAWLVIWSLPFFVTKFISHISDMVGTINRELGAINMDPTVRKFELLLSIFHFALYCATVYYKWQISSLINLVQPCHLILFLEGIALYSDSALGVLITLFLLPVLSGTLLAIFFPDVSGLDQFLEMELYWIQHYLILLVPIFLLSRWNFFALRFANAFTIYVGLSILGVSHFLFYEVIDLLTNVNVEFMLCPTSAMVSIFSSFPPWVTFPTYRTVLTFIVILLGYALSYLLIGAAFLVKRFYSDVVIAPLKIKPT